jgi:hypothetical protein
MAKNNSTNRVNNMSNNNETKVICPVCGSEFEIGAHEHTVKNATVIGADSGLGTIVLPVSKRGDALKAAGIDTSKYFAIPKQDGTEQLMTYDKNGVPVAVDADDPIIKAIIGGGTVPNRNLFRRWVMSQVFHGLAYNGYRGDGFTNWLNGHGYVYQWEMLIEELHVQAKLYGKDMENFNARNRWFNKKLAVNMANDYVIQLRKDADNRPWRKCKGVPYINISKSQFPKGVFVSDIDKKLIWPMRQLANDIERAKTAGALELAVRCFWKKAPVKSFSYKQCAEWKDAYKGMGAYATMQNLLRFHGCTFPKDNDFYKRGMDGLTLLEEAAELYYDEGWRLFGLMRQMIEENGIDIYAKMNEWKRAKARK